jgi:hypothetical protein
MRQISTGYMPNPDRECPQLFWGINRIVGTFALYYEDKNIKKGQSQYHYARLQ